MSKTDETADKSDSISMHDFLDFLKISCQLNESISETIDKTDKKVDYDQLAKNELIHSILDKCQANNQNVNGPGEKVETMTGSCDKKGNKRRSSRKSKDETKASLDPSLSEKLDEVIDEGILDSVLPFLCNSNNQSTSTITVTATHTCPAKSKTSASTINIGTNVLNKPDASNLKVQSETVVTNKTIKDTSGTSKLRRKSVLPSNSTAAESEVVIHVCDEVKGVSRDFTCPQKLLVAKMGYFADVTAGQRLEDMDISVHCDLQIFEWLIRWVKRESTSQETWCSLDPTNVVPILVSASFLQMEPLLVDCLSFCHANLNDVVKASANLSCLNDSIISRLAAMFTNTELEMVKDKKERVTPRLWTKLIQSLCEPESEVLRGHFASAADLYRCNRCFKHVTHSVSSYIHCVPTNLRLNRWGQTISQHSRDLAWNITSHVSALYKELKSWRKVYWRLWGNCHFLFCSTCETHFPVYQMNWCLYHPDQPQFLGPVTEGRMAGPSGRYPCCGQQAFRYETLPGPMGCQYREHTIHTDSDRDRGILSLVHLAEIGGCLYDAAPTRVNGSSVNDPWWNGITLAPSREKQGLLPNFNVNFDAETRYKHPRKLTAKMSFMDSSSETDTSENTKKYPMSKQFSTSSDGCESDDYSSPRPVVSRRKAKVSGRHWAGDLSARSNQDNQREFEERAMKQVIALVGKKTGGDLNMQYQTHQQGGTYMRLEAEWRESLKQRASSKPKNAK
ncbi:hypothetical protein HA402_014193 [Bradysia odoriphaga]|nr:hypothetical protein HA402_014193 [Bradysia odoriphaga]